MTNPFTPPFEQLPEVIPIFPLPGAIVLPDVELPLNIFEPRYLAMFADALKTDRLIGMIQTADPLPGNDGDDVGAGPIRSVGCGGRITSFQETHDGRMLIALTGLCRFRVQQELEPQSGYRRVRPDWSAYRYDMSGSSAHIDVDELINAVNEYLTRRNIEADVQGARSSSASHLINTLVMHLPFDADDKQSLLEAPDDTARGKLLMALCQADRAQVDPNSVKRH